MSARDRSGEPRADNLDDHTADGFDRIWQLYASDESDGDDPSDEAFDTYFSIFPVEMLAGAEGFELGSGNGRIAQSVARRAGFLHCVEPSAAGLAATRHAMRDRTNVAYHQASAGGIPLPDASQDFGYSIGVLHHIPDPAAGLCNCVDKLKPGAPFLLYVYYGLDNRPAWFRMIWRMSDVARRRISRMPFRRRYWASTFMAAAAYWPLSRLGGLLQKLGVRTDNLPLAYYIGRDWVDLRADALDRFGTALEHRFTKPEVEVLMRDAGLSDLEFADGPPYWTALGYKR